MTETWKKCEGQVVDSQFCLLQHLGSSEHSAVFLTSYGPEHQNAAIKLVQEDPAGAALQISRWELATKLSHPNLIRLFHVGRCRLNNAGLLYVVMEYAEENLAEVLRHRPLTEVEAREMLEGALDALAYLHRKGFVHGHLKPANIMGVADQLKISADGVYQGESKVGPAILNVFDAPELATGGPSPATDVWSLGATLVEALTQELPRWKDTQNDPMLPDRVPAAFLDIVRHCLRRDPERRWAVAEIAARLRQMSHAPEEQRSESSPRAFAKRRYIVPAAAVGLALAVIVVGPRLVNPRQGVGRTSSLSFEQPRAQERGDSTKRASNEEQSLPDASPATSPFRSQAEGIAPSGRPAQGEVLDRILPDVPAKARATIQGRVRVSVRVRVDPSGSVVDAKLDSAGPSTYFANLAMQAARRWKFRPTKIDGSDALSEWILRFEFLNNSTKALAVRARS